MMRCSADKIFHFSYLLAMLFFVAACERAIIPPDHARTGYDYFPLQTGQYHVYDVYRIDYNFAAENDTLIYQQKELISGSYLNQEGDSTFILHKLSRFNPGTQWKLDSIKHVRRTGSQLIEMGNNKAEVKLVFPVAEGKSWNSTPFTTAEADSFRMVNVHRSFNLADSLLKQTLTVVKRNIADTIVRQDIKREVFALRTGSVYRIHKTLNYCATADCIGQGIITSGVLEEMKLTETGKE